ncbi:GNAT family N-acetyltransferase [Streptomyces sp. NPDC002730]|uniref:GNAT family N-acetyltransferase n=1 Tax=Streptomyces sp. NPDC002730 TaxID=3364662 RepID=UPI0036782444
MLSLVPPAVAPGRMADTPQPVLQASYELVLRPWETDDAPQVIEAFSDPEIQKWHMLEVTTEEHARQWIIARQRSWQRESGANWAITNAKTGDIVGRAGLRYIDLRAGRGDCTYWVLPPARGQDIAARALQEIARWAFEDIGLHRVTAAHSTVNTASCRVATKAAFTFEGTMRSQTRHLDGWHDMHLHARIHSDKG